MTLHLAYLAGNFDWQSNYCWSLGTDMRTSLSSVQRRDRPGFDMMLASGSVDEIVVTGSLLLGESAIGDKAENEEVDIELPGEGDSHVDFNDETVDYAEGRSTREVTVSNDRGFPIVAELPPRVE